MQVMHPDDIRANRINLFDKCFCSCRGTKCVPIRQRRFKPMQINIHVLPDPDQFGCAGPASPPVGDVTLVSLLKEKLADVLRNPSGTSGINACIDL